MNMKVFNRILRNIGLTCLLSSALVQGGFQYPKDVMVKDEDSGGMSNIRKSLSLNTNPSHKSSLLI